MLIPQTITKSIIHDYAKVNVKSRPGCKFIYVIMKFLILIANQIIAIYHITLGKIG